MWKALGESLLRVLENGRQSRGVRRGVRLQPIHKMRGIRTRFIKAHRGATWASASIMVAPSISLKMAGATEGISAVAPSISTCGNLV
jgi:hypothetical protein